MLQNGTFRRSHRKGIDKAAGDLYYDIVLISRSKALKNRFKCAIEICICIYGLANIAEIIIVSGLAVKAKVIEDVC